jgi:hypothetical protein
MPDHIFSKRFGEQLLWCLACRCVPSPLTLDGMTPRHNVVQVKAKSEINFWEMQGEST